MTLTELIDQYEAARNEFLTKGKEAMTAAFKEFFVNNPDIKLVTWTQYSPYFNDGDECVFNVYAPTFANVEEGVGTYGEYEGDQESGVWLWGDDVYDDNFDVNPTEAEVKAMEEMNEIIQSSSMEDILEDLFGNHVKVTITRDGIAVDDHDHD